MFWVSKCKDCIMYFCYLITVKNLARKPSLVFTFERTKCQLLPRLCLSLSSVKPLFDIFPTLITGIFLFSSSLWKLLIKHYLRRTFCHYLDTSDFFCTFWRLQMHIRRWWEKDKDHRFSPGDAQRWCGSVISSSLLCHSPCRPYLLLGWMLCDGWREELSLSLKWQRWCFPSV